MIPSMYSSGQLMYRHLNWCIIPHFGIYCPYLWGAIKKGSDGVVAFEVHLDAQPIAGLFELSPKSFCVGHHD